MRTEFEKLPEIAEKLERHEHLFNYKTNQYECEDVCAEVFINGALYAYQQQQKLISMQECGATEIQAILNDSKCDDAVKLRRIKELLK